MLLSELSNAQVNHNPDHGLPIYEDLSGHELATRFLEGTGSLVLDREHRLAYACRSSRTNPEVVHEFCRRLQYKPVVFSATDFSGSAIYHTNVMLCVGRKFSIVCLEAITDMVERRKIEALLTDTGKQIICVSAEQIHAFAANSLELRSSDGPVIVMSTRALSSFNSEQKRALEQYGTLLEVTIPTIETCGGGGVRCLLAEVFLPPRTTAQSLQSPS